MTNEQIIAKAYKHYPPRYGAYGRDLNYPYREGYITALKEIYGTEEIHTHKNR